MCSIEMGTTFAITYSEVPSVAHFRLVYLFVRALADSVSPNLGTVLGGAGIRCTVSSVRDRLQQRTLGHPVMPLPMDVLSASADS